MRSNFKIIHYLLTLYLKGHRIKDAQYEKIIHDILSKTKKLSTFEEQLEEIKNTIGPCTLVTYNTYLELLRKLFPRNQISDSLLRALLLNINDDSQTFCEQGELITVYG